MGDLPTAVETHARATGPRGESAHSAPTPAAGPGTRASSAAGRTRSITSWHRCLLLMLDGRAGAAVTRLRSPQQAHTRGPTRPADHNH